MSCRNGRVAAPTRLTPGHSQQIGMKRPRCIARPVWPITPEILDGRGAAVVPPALSVSGPTDAERGDDTLRDLTAAQELAVLLDERALRRGREKTRQKMADGDNGLAVEPPSAQSDEETGVEPWQRTLTQLRHLGEQLSASAASTLESSGRPKGRQDQACHLLQPQRARAKTAPTAADSERHGSAGLALQRAARHERQRLCEAMVRCGESICKENFQEMCASGLLRWWLRLPPHADPAAGAKGAAGEGNGKTAVLGDAYARRILVLQSVEASFWSAFSCLRARHRRRRHHYHEAAAGRSSTEGASDSDGASATLVRDGLRELCTVLSAVVAASYDSGASLLALPPPSPATALESEEYERERHAFSQEVVAFMYRLINNFDTVPVFPVMAGGGEGARLLQEAVSQMIRMFLAVPDLIRLHRQAMRQELELFVGGASWVLCPNHVEAHADGAITQPTLSSVATSWEGAVLASFISVAVAQ